MIYEQPPITNCDHRSLVADYLFTFGVEQESRQVLGRIYCVSCQQEFYRRPESAGVPSLSGGS